jgi:hypothetical protein
MQGFSFAAFAIICAVLAIHDASPTDVPPNFITCSRGFIPLPVKETTMVSF